MGIALFLPIMGVLKLLTGVDLIAFSFLFFLIFEDSFDDKKFIIFMVFGELFNMSNFGACGISFLILYLIKIWQRKVFNSNYIFNILFFSIGYLFIRTACNFSHILRFNPGISFYLIRLFENFVFVLILFFSLIWVEKCLAKFTKRF